MIISCHTSTSSATSTGHLQPLLRLAVQLGYETERGWRHPEGRPPVFVGDLIDRGADSLAVVQLIRQLVQAGRAVCSMGNHEYNLLAWRAGHRPGDQDVRGVPERPNATCVVALVDRLVHRSEIVRIDGESYG